MWLEGYIVNAYNNYFQERYHRKPLCKRYETGENKLLITSIVKENAEKDFVRILKILTGDVEKEI